jgi:hypothetical protein
LGTAGINSTHVIIITTYVGSDTLAQIACVRGTQVIISAVNRGIDTLSSRYITGISCAKIIIITDNWFIDAFPIRTEIISAQIIVRADYRLGDTSARGSIAVFCCTIIIVNTHNRRILATFNTIAAGNSTWDRCTDNFSGYASNSSIT